MCEGSVVMDLNEAHKYIDKEVNLRQQEPRYFVPGNQDMNAFINLFSMIVTRVNTDKKVDFMENRLVKDYYEEDGKCYIKTDFGDAVFYRADEAIGKENAIQFIKLQFVDINGQVKNLAVPSDPP